MAKRPPLTYSHHDATDPNGSIWAPKPRGQAETPVPPKGIAEEPAGSWAKMPPPGPSNIIVRSSNPFPAPKDVASQ